MRRILAVTLLLAGPAQAENVLYSHFGNDALPSGGCFARSYSKAHLADHPDQLVTDISLSISPLSKGGKTPTLMVFVKMRGDPYYYSESATCKIKGLGLNCHIEGDGGSFVLTGEKDGVLRLTVGTGGIGFEGDKFVEISGTQGDDRAFLIPNVDGGICN